MRIDCWKTITCHPMGRWGLFLFGGMLALAVLGPVFSPYDPRATSYDTLAPPSASHWLGANDVGQDIAAQLAAGGRTSLFVALGAGSLSTLLACLVGTGAALGGGWIERLLMRFVDVILVLPAVILILLISAFITPHPGWMALVMGSLMWPAGARIIRAQTLSLKERNHVYAAAAFGAGKGYLLEKHLLPDLVPLLVFLFIQACRQAVFMEAGLAFIGVADPQIISWGGMIRQALAFCYMDAWKWWLLPVGLALSLSTLALTLLGHVLEEAVNPLIRGKRLGNAN